MSEPTDAQIDAFRYAVLCELDGGAKLYVFDFLDSDGDDADRALLGLPPSSKTSLLAPDEMMEFQRAIVRVGLKAAMNCKT